MFKIRKGIKYILWISVVLIVLSLLYFDLHLLKKHNEKNKPIPETVIIHNNTDYDIDLTSKVTLFNIFEHDSIYVKFEYMEEETFIEGNKLGAYVIKNPFFKNQYVIYMSKDIKIYQESIIIIHEMIHINQYETEKLIMLNPMYGLCAYDGDTISLMHTPYFERPFELDAYNTEDSIYNEVFKILEKK